MTEPKHLLIFALCFCCVASVGLAVCDVPIKETTHTRIGWVWAAVGWFAAMMLV